MDDGALGPLVERARRGEAPAFGELFQRFETDVARICRRLLGAGAAADDATSEVFLRARRGLDAYDAKRPFRPWLLGIANNLCIDLLRRRSVESRLFGDADLDSADLADPGPSPLRRLAGAEQRAEILAALEGLPEKYRLPLVLRYWSELDHGAIAELLGVRHEQVATLLYRARLRLREALGTSPPETS